MSVAEATEFLGSVLGLEDFAIGGVLPPSFEERWELYFRVQSALSQLRPHRSNLSKIAVSAEISGPVVIDDHATICPGATVQGPALIGRNAFVGNGSLIRPGTILAPNSIVGNHSYCTASLVGADAGVFHFCGISRSLVGPRARISAFVVTASARPDLEPVSPRLAHFDFKREKLGALIGAQTFIGAHVLIAPASMIGDDCFVGPYTTIQGEIPSGRYVYVNLPVCVEENQRAVASTLPRPSVSFPHLE